MARPAWERITTGRHGGSTVAVGPFRLIARRDSFDLVARSTELLAGGGDAKNEAAARKAAIDAARAKLADWAAELDALEFQDGGQ